MAFPNVNRFVLPGFMVQESIVNGVWNFVLSQYFQGQRFVVAPEYWTATNKRGDLIVLRTSLTNGDYRDPVFVLEGKKSGLNDNDWQAAIKQVEGYLKNLVTKTGQSSFGMLAAGQDFMLLRWSGTQLYRLTGNNLINGDTSLARGQAKHLSDLLHQAQAHTIFTLLVNSFPDVP